MIGHRFKILQPFGIPIYVDVSWLFIAVLITWSLAKGVFPAMWERWYPGEPESSSIFWAMGLLGALGLFVSIVLHELAHALVARREGVPMRGITLFIFGGVAEMSAEPPSPAAEFKVAIAGPVASLCLVLVFSAAGAAAVAASGWPVAATVLGYLASVNLLLVAFNLIPALPLDGGRVLRSALWHWKKDLRWATRISAAIGGGFGLGLIFVGVLQILAGYFVGGMWWVLIGLFLRSAASLSYQQVLARRVLEGEPVRRFMSRDPQDVPAGIPIRLLVDEYMYRLYHQMFPVTANGRLVGCVSTRQVREVPRTSWDQTLVRDIMEPCNEKNTVRADEDAMEALAHMHRTGVSRLLVVEDGLLVGVVTLKDLVRFIGLKLELEDTPRSALLASRLAHQSGL